MPHPFHVEKFVVSDFDRVIQNLAALSAHLCALTGLQDDFDAGRLAGHPTSLADANRTFDTEYCRIVNRHTPKLHGDFYQARTLGEVSLVRRRIADLAAQIALIPGFGGRYNADELDRRLLLIQARGGSDVLARINAEFDWERYNILQKYPRPAPRPVLS